MAACSWEETKVRWLQPRLISCELRLSGTEWSFERVVKIMFPITKVDPHQAEALEPLGTKRKFWYRDKGRRISGTMAPGVTTGKGLSKLLS